MDFLGERDWNKDKNELTWKLFGAGYTEDNHPDGVRWVGYKYEFEYTPGFIRNTVLESPCGLLVKGDDFSGYMSYMGIDWRVENNNSVHRCPYGKEYCELNHEYLQEAFGPKSDLVQCAFHFSNKVYNYEKSYEKAWDDFYAMQSRKKDEFYKRLKWDNPNYRHCECIRWDDVKQNWYAKYDPWNCVHGCHRWGGVCVLTGKSLDGKKGNVFYDVKVTRIRHDGSLWDEEPIIYIEKGQKMFNNPKPMAICEAYAKTCKHWILSREKDRYHQELFFKKDMTVEVLNVRAEVRESRDLLQDLRDVAEGIVVTHASDLAKQRKQDKRERRKRYLEAKKRARENRNIRQWKRFMSDDEAARAYAQENGISVELVKWEAEEELKKRGIKVKLFEQLSIFDMSILEGIGEPAGNVPAGEG